MCLFLVSWRSVAVANPTNALSNIPRAPNRTLRFIQKFAEDRFAALDVAHAGKLPIVAVRTFVKGVCQGTEQQVGCALCTRR